MLTIVKSQPTGLDSYDLATLPKGAWINLLAPSQTELAQVAEATQISVDILRAALDEEERSRTELDDNCLLTVINIPVRQGEYYDTLPLGIILSEDYIVTVCLTDNEVLQGFTNRTWRFFNTSKRTRFMFQMMYRTATLFLKNLQHITRMTDALERNLRQSMQNDDLFEMLEMQLNAFEKYYDLAVSHHQPELIIIHGVGEGKLRNEIHEALRLKNEVKSFVNQFHPLYGFGATEIYFK